MSLLEEELPQSSFDDGTTQNGTRPPPLGVAGAHHTKRLVYGGLGLGLTLSEEAASEGLEGSEWLLVGIGASESIIIELRVSV